ncbi:hypothetical protein Ddc_22750 [Ditylenchus destructor]|nr:hypothetical protein Ddc_22750 [Ditylenchus destructor]
MMEATLKITTQIMRIQAKATMKEYSEQRRFWLMLLQIWFEKKSEKGAAGGNIAISFPSSLPCTYTPSGFKFFSSTGLVLLDLPSFLSPLLLTHTHFDPYLRWRIKSVEGPFGGWCFIGPSFYS